MSIWTDSGDITPAGSEAMQEGFNVILAHLAGQYRQLAEAIGVPPDASFPVNHDRILRIAREVQHRASI